MLMRLRRRKRSEKISIYGKKSKRTVIAALCYSARDVIQKPIAIIRSSEPPGRFHFHLYI